MEPLCWSAYFREFNRLAAAQGFSKSILTELNVWNLTAWERPAPGPTIYLSAGIHGDEPAGPLALLELMREGFFHPDVHWLLCPMLNPTGMVLQRRENESGTDLNRDYWTRSSQETAAHVRWLDSCKIPDLFVSLHEDWESSGFYFYEINLNDDRADRAKEILNAVADWFAPEAGPVIDGHDSREAGWIYHSSDPDIPEGWPEAIYLAKKGCPISFTFETPSRASLDNRVAAHAAAVRSVCNRLIREIGQGSI